MDAHREEIAATILMQLTDNRCGTGTAAAKRLSVAVGARDFLILESGVSFRIMRNAARITHVSIKLAPEDTYRVEFGRLRKLDYTVLEVAEGVHCDQLRQVFETATSLYLIAI